MKVFFRRIHLYLALGAGLIIMVTCLTGAILIFEKELMQLFNKNRYYTSVQIKRLPLDTLIKNVMETEPSAKISSVKVYSNPSRTVEISFSKKAPANKKEQKNTVKEKAKPAEGPRLLAFVDPYSGKIVEVYNHRESFFYWVMDVHRWMLGGDIGKIVVGVSTLIFLAILLTGVILWWPRNRQILKQRLRIKADAGFKRLNHDYHIVFWFTAPFSCWYLPSPDLRGRLNGSIKGSTLLQEHPWKDLKLQKVNMKDPTVKIGLEQALQSVTTKIDNAVYYNLALPKDSSEAYSVGLLAMSAQHESASDTYYVDAYSGEILGMQLFKDRNTGQRVRATFKPVHVASIYGLPSKIIGLMACLLGTFFPASGFIMWLNRTRRKRK